jgi:protein gp37
MTTKSSIEWSEMSWNPITGCDEISPGCDECYARTFAERWRGVSGHPYEQGFDLKLWPERLEDPLKRKKPSFYFVNSMSDPFHERVPFEFVAQMFETMERAHWHTFQILTKRARRMRDFVEQYYTQKGRKVPENIWLGVSVENSDYLWRAEVLRNIPCSVRVISAEPLLSTLDSLNLEGIGWLITGGESGPRARPMDLDWVRTLRDKCIASGVPFFHKQHGSVDPETGINVGKKVSGRVLDGRTWDEKPDLWKRECRDAA